MFLIDVIIYPDPKHAIYILSFQFLHYPANPFNDDFGSRVSKLLFENMDPLTALDIKDEITQSIVNFEPRVSLMNVSVTPNYDTSEFDTVITYQIIGAEAAAQQLSFAREQGVLPTRVR